MENTIVGAQSDFFASPAEAEPIGTIEDREGRELWLFSDGSTALVAAHSAEPSDFETSGHGPVGSFQDADGVTMWLYADGSYSAFRGAGVAAK